MVHSTDGNKGVQHLYSAVVALFPEGWARSNRAVDGSMIDNSPQD